MTWRAGTVLLALVALVTVLVPTPPAGAQDAGDGSLSLTGQTTFVRPGGFFDLELRVAGVGVRHTITVEVYPAVRSRFEFLGGLRAGRDLGPIAHRVEAVAPEATIINFTNPVAIVTVFLDTTDLTSSHSATWR